MYKIKSKRLAGNLFFALAAVTFIAGASFTGNNLSFSNGAEAADCSVFNGDQSSCQAQGGCTWDSLSCSAFNGNQSACELQSPCVYPGNTGDCSALDESTCGSTSGCTVNTSNCTWDGAQCNGGGSCSGYGDEGSCNSGTYFTGCSGSYDTGACTGSYEPGTCSGSYDITAPTLSTAVVNTTTLTLTYNEALDTGSVPGTSAFVVTVAGSPITPSSLNVTGSTVILTLATTVGEGTTVTVSYTPGASPIQDIAGNAASSLSGQSVTNSTDSTSPIITNVSSDKIDGSYKAGEIIDIDVTFSESVTSTGSVTVTLETGDTDRTCTFTVSGATTGTCNYTVQVGDTTSDLTVKTISGTIVDIASNAMTNFVPAVNLATNKNIIIDTDNPTFSTAIALGRIIRLTYNEILDSDSTPVVSAFIINVNGSPVSKTSVSVTSTNVEVTLPESVGIGTTVTVSYTPGASPIQDIAGNDASSLSGQSVTNNTNYSIPVGSIPNSSSVVGTKLYVNNSNSNNVSVIDTTTDTVTATIAVGASPTNSVAVGNKVYVVNNAGGSVSVIDTNTDTVSSTIAVGAGPSYPPVAVGNKVYVVNNAGGSVSVIDTNTDTVSSTIAVGGFPYTASVAGNKVYIMNYPLDEVEVIDTTTDTIVANIDVGTNPYSGSLIGTKLYVNNSNSNNVSVIDTTTDTVTATIPVGTFPEYSTVVGTKIYVPNPLSNSVSVIDTTTNTVVATIPVGTNPIYSSVIRTKLYVTNSNSNNVSVIDTTTDTVTATIAVGANSVSSSAVGNKVYVNSYNYNSVSVIDALTDTILNVDAPHLTSITSSSANGTYTSGQSINITANFDQTLASGSKMRVTLNTGDVVNLTTVSGSTLAGTYTVGSGDSTPDLSVSSISSDSSFTNVSDTDSTPNTRTSYEVPASPELTGDTSRNLGDLKNIVITGPYCSVSVGTQPYQLATAGTITYVANQGSDDVSVIDTADNNTVIDTINVGSQPYGVAYNSTSKEVYVANLKGNSVSVIDADPLSGTYNTVTHTVNVGVEPYYVASLGTNMYVTNNLSNTVSVIATGSHTVTNTINVGVAPRGIKAHGTDLYVANFGSGYGGGSGAGTVSVINSTNNTVTATINVGSGPRGVAVNGNEVYVANWNDNTVSVISTASNTVTNTISVGSGPRGVLSLGSNIYVENYKDGTISVIATGSHSVTDTVGVGNTPAGMTAVGTDIYVSRFTDGVVSILDTTASPKALRSSCSSSDSTPPTVTLTVPSTGATVYGSTVTLTATSSDDTAVTGVQFNVDGIDVGDASTTSPYSIIWDSTSVTNATHTIYAVAHDAAGNYATSSISVTVDNYPPTLSITAPADASTVTTFSPSVSWGDSSTCEYKFDSGSFASLTCASNGSDIPAPSSGAHTLTIRGTDASTNATTTSSSFTYSPVTTTNNTTSSQPSGGATGWSTGGSTQTPIYAKSPNPLCPIGYTCTPIISGSNFGGANTGAGNNSANTNSQIPEGYKFFRDLTIGSRGTDVQRLQQFLNENLFQVSHAGAGAPGKETTIFGPATKAALSRFQKAHAVQPSIGYFGAITRKLVNYMLGL